MRKLRMFAMVLGSAMLALPLTVLSDDRRDGGWKGRYDNYGDRWDNHSRWDRNNRWDRNGRDRDWGHHKDDKKDRHKYAKGHHDGKHRPGHGKHDRDDWKHHGKHGSKHYNSHSRNRDNFRHSGWNRHERSYGGERRYHRR